MKALTLTQPWATLVILGIKHWETRGWYPAPENRTGRIAIHAAKGWRKADREFANDLREIGVLPFDVDLPLGAVLGTVRLDGLIRTTVRELVDRHISPTENMLGDWSPHRYGWELGDPRPFPEPIPARGALGLWEWHPDPAVPG